MKEYDYVVVGSGAGLIIAENALYHGSTVALIDKGPLGGTCLNLGCIPSKMLIFPADRVAEIRDSAKLGVTAKIRGINFEGIMERMRMTVGAGEKHIRVGIRQSEGLDYYEGEGRFIKDFTLEVNGKIVKGKKIVLATGARPLVPEIPGLKETGFLTNETVLKLTERPKSIIIIGGGYIACEYAHFFDAIGVGVTLLQRNARLVPGEEPEISALLMREMSARMQVFTSTEAVKVTSGERGVVVTARDKTGKQGEFGAERIMLAAGRKSNADILMTEKSGIKTDRNNFVKVDRYFETTKKGIWAFGDATGREMFRHVANREAALVWQNAAHGAKAELNYNSAPHAIFSYPEIASVGMTEQSAREAYGTGDLLIGKAKYSDVARGEAMMEEHGFAKAVVHKKTGKILGFHIIGPSASILIQEIVNAMANDSGVSYIFTGMHIHPALSELIPAVLSRLEEPD